MDDKTYEYLGQIKKIKNKIRRLQDRSYDVQDMLESCTVDPGNEKVDSSKQHDKFGALVAKKVDLDHEIEECIIDYMEQSQNLEDLFSLMNDDKYEDVLINRYIYGMSWKQIGEEMGYSPRWIVKLHDRAIAAFREVIQNADTGNVA